MVMVALQRSYLGQRLYRTVTGRGFSTNPTSLGPWRWPIFSVVALIAFSVTVVPLMVLLMGTFMRAFGFQYSPTLDDRKLAASACRSEPDQVPMEHADRRAWHRDQRGGYLRADRVRGC